MILTTDFLDDLLTKTGLNSEYTDHSPCLAIRLSNKKISFRFIKNHKNIRYGVKIGSYPTMSIDQAREICRIVSNQMENHGLTDVRAYIRLHSGLKFRGGRLKLDDYIPVQPKPRKPISKLRKRGWKPIRGLFG